MANLVGHVPLGTEIAVGEAGRKDRSACDTLRRRRLLDAPIYHDLSEAYRPQGVLSRLVKERDDEKLRRLREVMTRYGLDALLLRLPENLAYISGYWPLFGLSYLFYPLDGEPCILAYAGEEEYCESWIHHVRAYSPETLEKIGSHLEQAAPVLDELLDPKSGSRTRVGVEASNENLVATYNRREAWSVGPPTLNFLTDRYGRTEFVDFTPQLRELRSIKTDSEVKILRRVNELADIGLEAFDESLQVGKQETEIAAEVEAETSIKATGHKGAKRVIVMAYVMSGPESAKAHRMVQVHTQKRIQSGDLVLLQLTLCADGYWSDVTRTYPVAHASIEQEKGLEAVREAQTAALDVVRDGVRAREVNEAAFAVLRKHTYSDQIRHRIGHGIGCHIHEPVPAIHPVSEDVIRKNMVHTLEPGIYFPGKFGVRIEDVVLDGRNRGEYLTRYRR